MKTGRLLPTLALLAVLPIIPYAIWGYTGHDFQIQLTMWMELRTAWQHGQFVPGWCSLANFTLGSPRFCFYPPLSYLIGTLLSVVLPFRLAPAAFVWLATFASGLSMYKASRFFVRLQDRFTATVLYMWSPYLLFTAIIRFAFAELLVLVWMPLVLLYFYEAIWERQKRAAVLLGCLFALSWLSDVPAAIILFYVLSIVAAIAAARRRSLSPVLYFCVAQSAGAALAAFSLLPSYFEQKWISATGIFRADLQYFFIFGSLAHFNGGSRFLLECWAIACCGIIILAACAYSVRKLPTPNIRQRTLIELATVAFVFQLPFSIVLWRHLPELLFTDFPYRFLSVMGAAVPLVLLAKETPRRLRKPAYCLLLLTALFPFLDYARLSIEKPNPRLSNVLTKWQQQGYLEMAEFMPAGTAGLREHIPHLPPITVIGGDAGSECKAALEPTTPQPRIFSTDSAGPCRVRLALFFYPYWRAVDETGKSLPVERAGEGLLAIDVPPGQHRVEMEFKATSPLRTASLLVSVSSGLLVMLFLAFERRRKPALKHFS